MITTTIAGFSDATERKRSLIKEWTKLWMTRTVA